MASNLATLSKWPIAAKAAFGLAVGALVAIAYWAFFYGDVAGAIDAQKKQEANLRTELDQAKQNEFAYQRDLGELAHRQQRQREFNKLLPEKTEYPSFLSALQGVANVSGVALQGWAPQEEIVEQFYAKVPMKLSLLGKFHQVAKFFYGVGQLDRIINIENIALSLSKEQGDDVLLKVECLATAFHSVVPKPVAAEKSSAAPAPGAKR